MTRGQLAVVAGLLVLATLLTVLTGIFDGRRRLVAAEGNDLRTGESAWVTASLHELDRERSAFAPGTKVFVSLDDGVRGVAVLAGRWTDVPLHDGHAPVGTKGEALVGADIEVSNDTISVDGTAYTVVGRLGLRAGSLLSDDVVIVDPSLFSEAPQRLLLDGPGSVRRYTAAFPGRSVEVISQGTDRRTNVDTVSPALVALSVLVVMLVTVIAGALAGWWELRAAAVRFRIGIRRLSCLRVAGGKVGLISVVTCSAALAAETATQALSGIEMHIAPAAVAMAAVSFTSAAAVLLHGSRQWSC